MSAWVLPCGASIQTDTAFGSSGIVVTDYGIGDDQVNSVAIQSDGKIAAVGSSFNGAVYNAAVARYTADVITSYSIHYTKLYEIVGRAAGRPV